MLITNCNLLHQNKARHKLTCNKGNVDNGNILTKCLYVAFLPMLNVSTSSLMKFTCFGTDICVLYVVSEVSKSLVLGLCISTE